MKDDSTKLGVQSVVQDLVIKSGSVTPSQLVKAAEPESSPAHAGFQWDNEKAAHEHRLNQARRWLKVVIVTYSEHTEHLVHVPVAPARSGDDADSGEGEYRPLTVVVGIPDQFQRALDETRGKLLSARRAFDVLNNAAEKVPQADRTALIAAISRGFDVVQDALAQLH